MHKTVVICQSNYIPWKGYFDMINMADEFVIYDNVQYTRRDWRNRNKIITPCGVEWLTIPVEVKGKYYQKINETKVSGAAWAKHHWTTLQHCYSKSKYFKEYKVVFEEMYLDELQNLKYLSDINELIIKTICSILGVNTKIINSNIFEFQEDKNERLLAICQKLGATIYLSGPAAKNYINIDKFLQSGVLVEWMEYSAYPKYEQCYSGFEHGVSILDLLFNCGPESKKYMKSFNDYEEFE